MEKFTQEQVLEAVKQEVGSDEKTLECFRIVCLYRNKFPVGAKAKATIINSVRLQRN